MPTVVTTVTRPAQHDAGVVQRCGRAAAPTALWGAASGHAGDGGRAVGQHRDARGGGLARVGARGGGLDAPGGRGEPFHALGAPHCASFRPFMGSEWPFLRMNRQNRPQLAHLIIK